MQNISRLVKILGIAMCLSVAIPVYAESAPVFDADTMQPDDNQASDQSQDLPPPPPPGQESGAFVPGQTPQVSVEPPPAPQMTQSTLDQRMRRIEQRIDNMQTNDPNTRVDSLQDQVQALRGQVEQLTHQLEQLQNQQKNMYTDLDKQLSQLAANQTQQQAAAAVSAATGTATNAGNADDDTSAPAPVKPVKSTAAKSTTKSLTATPVNKPADAASNSQPNVAEEQQIYQTAYNLIKAKKYNEAVTALQGMLKKYPSGQFASNAHYWLGELYGLLGKNDLALSEFNSVVKTFPDSPRVSDAQLKVALILASQLKWPDAKAALKKVINHYPGTASARLAAEQLKQIKQAGH